MRLGQTASDDAIRASYVDIAARWNVLAAEMERWLVRESKGHVQGEPGSQSDGDRR